MNAYLERLNMINDPRNCEAAKPPVIYDDEGNETPLPTCWGLCPVCNGEGTHVNPAIDEGGLTCSDFERDPDFFESYKRGDFDIPCNFCNGRTTVKVLDRSMCSDEQLAQYDQEQEWEREHEAERRAEFLMGC